ncbi:MAG: AbrB/MazE/SpoVT family DNA-binding domain-containing protein [Actinomycetota bacterium]
MNTTAQVSEKGQVTIPKAIRDRLGIRPGQVLEFREERGRLIATKAPRRDPVDEVYGILTTDQTTDEFMDEIRGTPDAV